jgi:hypothetical protein
MIIHSNIDTLLSGKFLRWSENILDKPQISDDLFTLIGTANRSDDGTRANELFRLGLFDGSLLGKKAGWNLLKEDKNIHSRLGFLSYIIGKAISQNYMNEKIEKSISALCVLFALQTGEILEDKCFSVIGLSFYLKKYFPQPDGVIETKYWRYLTSLLFCTWYDSKYKAELLNSYFTQKPINELYLISEQTTTNVSNTNFSSFINSNISLSNIKPPKYSLFWVGNFNDIKPRGLFTQSLLVGRKLLEIASGIEHEAIQNGKISPFHTVIAKSDNKIIPCVIESCQYIFSTHNEGKTEFW